MNSKEANNPLETIAKWSHKAHENWLSWDYGQEQIAEGGRADALERLCRWAEAKMIERGHRVGYRGHLDELHRRHVEFVENRTKLLQELLRQMEAALKDRYQLEGLAVRATRLEAAQKDHYSTFLADLGDRTPPRAARSRLEGLILHARIAALLHRATGRGGEADRLALVADSWEKLAALNSAEITAAVAERGCQPGGDQQHVFPCGPLNSHTSALHWNKATGELTATTDDYTAPLGEWAETVGVLVWEADNGGRLRLLLTRGGKPTTYCPGPDALEEVAGTLQESHDIYPVGAEQWDDIPESGLVV